MPEVHFGLNEKKLLESHGKRTLSVNDEDYETIITFINNLHAPKGNDFWCIGYDPDAYLKGEEDD